MVPAPYLIYIILNQKQNESVVKIYNPSWKVWGEEHLHPQLSAKSKI